MVNPFTSTPRYWIQIGFLLWTALVIGSLANSMRTRGVDQALIRTGSKVSVLDTASSLDFLPSGSSRKAGLIFFCGSGVAAAAYAPLLRPLAEAGYPVFVVKLPFRFALLSAHENEAIARARRLMKRHPEIGRWVIAGHSLGGALAARLVHADHRSVAALLLIGTTHPKQDDLSLLQLPVTKIYATNDGIARRAKVLSNARLLPERTRWVRIEGGNHSQFGHYGHQLFDGKATISREVQQAATRSELLERLSDASK